MKTLLAVISIACGATIAQAQQAKPGPELKYAVIVSRHGVRSPTWTLERLNQYSASPWPDWGAPPGNLTAHGRALMKIMGTYYHDYFSAVGLLGKPNCYDAKSVYFWADTDQRTLETGRALAEGVLPGCKAEIHSAGENKSDPLFNAVEAGVAKQDPKVALAAVTGRIGPKLDALLDAHRPAFDTLNRVLNGDGKAALSIFAQPVSLNAGEGGVSMGGPLSLASTLTEDFLLEYTNGMSGDKLGWGRLNASNLQQMMSLHTAYADLMRRTPYLAQGRGSNLMSHVLRSLEQAVAGKAIKGAIGAPDNTLAVISGHDTNLSNLSGMLGLSWLMPSYQADDVPPGGALIFSLWREAGADRYSVRLQFTTQTLDQMHDATPLSLAKPPATADIFIPGCSGANYACEWTAFRATATATIVPGFVEK